MRKRIFLLMIISVLLFTGTFNYKTALASQNNIIRVRISITGKSININVDGEYIIKEDPAISLPRGSYTVSVLENNTIGLKGMDREVNVGNKLTLVRCKYEGNGNNHLTIRGTDHGNINYLGDFVFTINSGNIRVVNHISLEEYLYGVVAYEMSNSYPLEALKAQAVSARGYAARAMASSSGDYDIGDKPNHQVYKGFNPSYTKVIEAVNSTAGEVLSYKGKIVETYYAASNGGQTDVPGNIWGLGKTKEEWLKDYEYKKNLYPYMVIKDDPYDLENPGSLYQELFVPKQVEGAGYLTEPNVPGENIVITANLKESCNVRSGPGTNHPVIGKAYVNTAYEWLETTNDSWYKIKFEGQDAYISRTYSKKVPNGRFLYENVVLSDIQTKLHASLTSQGVEVEKPTDIKIMTIDEFQNGQEQYPGTGARSYVTAIGKAAVAYIPKGSTELFEQSAVDFTLNLMVKSGNSFVTYSMAHDYLDHRLRMRGVKQAEAEGGYYITNARYGHGVGMSQRGAQTMAGVYGMSYMDILGFYYEGTSIMQIGSYIPELPDPANNPGITSPVHNIGSEVITGLSTNLPVETFLSNISVVNGTVSIISSGEPKITGVIATGDVLQLKDSAGAVFKEYPLVIYGDVDGDGDINLIDIFDVHRHIIRVEIFKEPYAKAADVNGDGDVNLIDIFDIHRHIIRIEDIKQ
jgi:peptidoglycan hydrolase-like amidase